VRPSTASSINWAIVNGTPYCETLPEFGRTARVFPTSRLPEPVGTDNNHKSDGVGLADAIIAVSVEAEKAELKTLNIRHYPMMKGLVPAYEK
jgi:hypothetical protein